MQKIQTEILELEKKIVEMSKRPRFYAEEITRAKMRLRSLRRSERVSAIGVFSE